MARKLTGEATAEELNELEQLLEQDPVLKNTAKKMEDAWHESPGGDMQKALSSFARIDKQIQKPSVSAEPAVVRELPGARRKRYRIAWIAAAACVVLLAGAWFVFFNTNPGREKAIVLQEISTPSKTIREIKLPDGSTVRLNEGSKLEYSNAFNDQLREVTLSGEAFFDVVKDKEKPFIIHANKVNIRVLGTAFNIKSYPGEGSVETSLIRGSVEVTINDEPGKKYILKPNQKLVVPLSADTAAAAGTAPAAKEIRYDTLRKIAYTPSDTLVAELSWIDLKLAFYESSFK